MPAPSATELPFQALQARFTAHLRDPARVPIPDGVEDRRMAVYRELLYNNVQGFMANCFPVVRKILGDSRWHALVRDYFARHRAHTPLFPKMPQEFVRYLDSEREAGEDPPFMRELAHYEWVEAALALDAREFGFDGIDADGDMLEGVPALSPLAWPFAYRYPVHRLSPEFQPVEPPATPTYLVVFRDRRDEVRFLELNSVSARLLELLQAPDAGCGREILVRIAAELHHPQPDAVISAGAAILEDLRRRDIVLGVRSKLA